MNREIYLKQISDTLGILRHQVENRNSIQLYDINILAEDFFKDLLNFWVIKKLAQPFRLLPRIAVRKSGIRWTSSMPGNSTRNIPI